jgi:hypothetical protein
MRTLEQMLSVLRVESAADVVLKKNVGSVSSTPGEASRSAWRAAVANSQGERVASSASEQEDGRRTGVEMDVSAEEAEILRRAGARDES